MARWLILTATMALIFGHEQGLASAQDPAPDPPEVLVVDDGFDPDQVTGPKNPVSLPESFFERYFLGDVAKLDDWHEKMDRLFETQMRLAEKVSKFSANEERKLRLAAKGDIKHLADELEMARTRVEKASADLHALNALLQSYRPLRLKALSGPFRSDSLFQKTLEGIRRKQRERAVEPPSGAMLRGAMATLHIALLALQEPPPETPKPPREVIEDAPRIPVAPETDHKAILRNQELRRQKVIHMRMMAELAMIDSELAMPEEEQPPKPDPLTLIDDFERENPRREVETEVETKEVMPDGFVNRYFLHDRRGFPSIAERWESFIESRLKIFDMSSPLTELDKRKLRLAAQGDLKRLRDDLAAAKIRLEQVWPDQNARLTVLASLEELRRRAHSNPFRSNSLFQKTLEGIRRKQSEGAAKPPSGASFRSLLVTLSLALLAPTDQGPPAAKPKTLRQLIDDASRLPAVRRDDDKARLLAQERFEQAEQLRLQIELAMPPEKPEDIDPLTAIDDFEREPPAGAAAVVEPALETMPEGFIDRYFLGMPRDSSGFASRVRRFLLAQLKSYESTLELSAADKEKLRLAAQGDLKRLDDELAAARNRLEQAWPNHNARMLVLASLEELRTRARSNPFQGQSLVGKTLRKIAREKGVS